MNSYSKNTTITSLDSYLGIEDYFIEYVIKYESSRINNSTSTMLTTLNYVQKIKNRVNNSHKDSRKRKFFV